MSANILSGKPLADRIKQNVKTAVEERVARGLSEPGLAVILVGDDLASQSYVNHKRRTCEQTGIRSVFHHLPQTATADDIAQVIDQCNQDTTIHGILLQLPLPAGIDNSALLERIDHRKDVDGFHPYNMGRLAQGRPLLRPCTPYGVMHLLAETGVTLTGLNAVVVGQSNIVGRPMALELAHARCTVTMCHSATKNLEQQVRQADLLVVAIGNPNVIQSEWLKSDAIVIDVGFNHLADGQISGDIDFDSAKEQVAWLTPVPGGVGLMTVATLMQNTLQAAKDLEGD